MRTMLKTKDLLSLFIGACMLGAPLVASAAPLPQLTTTPVVIDDKAKARDILQEKVTITIYRSIDIDRFSRTHK
jgi:hypothetical protein